MKAQKVKVEGGLVETRLIVSPDEISQDPANVRKHSQRNVDAIVASLRAYGQRSPIVINKRGIILKGNGTYMAAAKMGLDELWVTITELEGTDATAYAIADNRTAELAEWDLPALGLQFKTLKDIGFDLNEIGFLDFEASPIMNADWTPAADTDDEDDEGVSEADGDTQTTKPGIPLGLTSEQREIVNQAIQKVREMAEDTTLSEGRCVELICADYLAGADRESYR